MAPKLVIALVATAILQLSGSAQAQSTKSFECYSIEYAPVEGDQIGRSLSTKKFEVEALDDKTGHDALVQCTKKLNDERKRANRRVMRA